MKEWSELFNQVKPVNQEEEDALAQLKEGVDDLHRELERLREQNKDLRATRATLEEQVMEMARQPEPNWDQVIFVFGEDEDDDHDDDPELMGAA